MSKGNADRGAVKDLSSNLQGHNIVPVRVAAAESMLQLSKSEQGCAMLCSAGGLHSLFLTLKERDVPPDVLRLCCKTLCKLYAFDGKTVAVVARLQGGIKALVDSVREHMQGGDLRLLQWLLCALSDITHTALNIAALVQASGIPIALATLLAHLRIEQLRRRTCH
ncbi:hypothetical protein T492DRAFT_75307 [Pavlovales sp. CCMP2436]|nr:hypothetical protein T492DRAFT_75307 [Pavlovales sp. CCMP2436]